MTSGPRFSLCAPARLAQEIRKSRFVAQATTVESEVATREFLERVAEPDATHNCWAWRVGTRYRFSDDGEPAGTAGRPILRAIDGQNLDGVIVVVTRWFGGIRLGAGGLVRAYGGCAAECLRTAPKRELIDTVRAECVLTFSALPRLRARLCDFGAAIETESFGSDGVTLTLCLPASHFADLRTLVADLSRGQAMLNRLD
jgi:uncharacterized YigZ family protein